MKRDHGNQLRFGIVGAGRIAESYAWAFQSARNARLTCIADNRATVAGIMAEKLACAHFDSHLALAESGLIDAVVVATPPATHSSICLDFLDRKIPVLCEKPVSLDAESARLIRRRAGESRTLFTMASKFRYVEDVVRAHSIVSSGILGQIVLFENTFMSNVDMSGRWNANPAVSGGGVLIDNGTHSADIMRYFIGRLSSIHVVSGIRLQDVPVEDTVHVTVRAENGATDGWIFLGASISNVTITLQYMAQKVRCAWAGRAPTTGRMAVLPGYSSDTATTKSRRSAIRSKTSAPPFKDWKNL